MVDESEEISRKRFADFLASRIRARGREKCEASKRPENRSAPGAGSEDAARPGAERRPRRI